MNSSPKSNPGIYGLLGHNIGYSRSPAIHNHVFREFGINAIYGLFDMPPERFHTAVPALVDYATGFNVTVPYKEKIIPFLDGLSPEAKTSGSVNHVFNRLGYNTDYLALRDLVSNMISDYSGKECIIFGAGGAARTVAFLLGNAGLNLRIVNRTIERAEQLEADLDKAGIRAETVLQPSEIKNDILKTDCAVNCISAAEFQFPRIIADLAIDFNYGARAGNFRNRIETSSLFVTGEQILIKQAIYSQKIWNEIEPSFDDLMGVLNVE